MYVEISHPHSLFTSSFSSNNRLWQSFFLCRSDCLEGVCNWPSHVTRCGTNWPHTTDYSWCRGVCMQSVQRFGNWQLWQGTGDIILQVQGSRSSSSNLWRVEVSYPEGALPNHDLETGHQPQTCIAGPYYHWMGPCRSVFETQTYVTCLYSRNMSGNSVMFLYNRVYVETMYMPERKTVLHRCMQMSRWTYGLQKQGRLDYSTTTLVCTYGLEQILTCCSDVQTRWCLTTAVSQSVCM
jgi:hypothetical protein